MTTAASYTRARVRLCRNSRVATSPTRGFVCRHEQGRRRRTTKLPPSGSCVPTRSRARGTRRRRLIICAISARTTAPVLAARRCGGGDPDVPYGEEGRRGRFLRDPAVLRERGSRRPTIWTARCCVWASLRTLPSRTGPPRRRSRPSVFLPRVTSTRWSLSPSRW